jgi:hypothetical protein
MGEDVGAGQLLGSGNFWRGMGRGALNTYFTAEDNTANVTGGPHGTVQSIPGPSAGQREAAERAQRFGLTKGAETPEGIAGETIGGIFGPNPYPIPTGGLTPATATAVPRRVSPELSAAAEAETKRLGDITQRGKEAGFTLPPPGSTREVHEAYAAENYPKVKEVLREDVGLPSDAPLTPPMMQAIRRIPSPEVQQIKAIPEIDFGKKYQASADAIKTQPGDLAEALPGYKPNAQANQKIEALAESIKPPSGKLSGDQAVALHRSLRDEGRDLYQAAKVSGSPEDFKIAAAHNDAAEAVESAIKDHLEANGQPDLAAAWDAHTVRMAKTYDIERATDLAGNPDPGKLSRQLFRRGGGNAMSGGTETVANLAAQYPQAFKVVTENAPAKVSAARRFAAKMAPIGGAAVGSLVPHPFSILTAPAATAIGENIGQKILGR